ncbi:RecQ family ATP-dependent DNA helicase [Colwellia sp. 1_MG-2023]|uniref:RecQ family ATP-dependent DNA helicase n=1 Tax=Colwellia sp. 1_MG-2023 TaxID=3062649 RepID=UPI0026E19AF2|nr:RecQ family ATP-dependent DNA helicase [Colwellia sp. 1_MG-2023]MDO6446578.1 RecQ family ATP-dependent DNA helicase [Colwellia sp. 1_MG-2023]
MTNQLTRSLQEVFAFDGFRQGQEQTIEQLLQGYSSLAIFPTGSGKSLCYQFTATQLPHLTLLVSPLLALMKDQLAFLESKGIAAASIDSSLTAEQNQQVMADVRNGHLKVLMVSVERFKNERFRQFISSVEISMLVVDEAHCISEWGHNFRPDYLKLPAYQQALNIPLVLLLTATATKKVKNDMASKFAISSKHIVQTGFYRENLTLSVTPVLDVDKNQQLLQHIQQQSGCGIVYVTLQHSAEQVADFLVKSGLNAHAYHAGFDSDMRTKIQDDFMSGKVEIIVATIAFGMGIDKSDIRFVIHYDLPKSIENYSQEIGRAGRDGLSSNCITLANLDGLNTVENFVYGDTPELTGIEQVLTNIREEQQAGRWELQGLTLSNASNIRQLPMKTLLVQLELHQVIKPLYSYFADFKYKFITNKDEILNTFAGERREFLYAVFQHSKFKKVWGEPDFEQLFQHYQCERSRVVTALEYLQELGHITLETKKITEVFSVNETALSTPFLANKLHDYFLDKEQSEIKRIAALIRFFELEQCLTRNLSLYFDDQHAPENCGHCSVCRGQVATLAYSSLATLPSDDLLKSYIKEVTSLLKAKSHQTISTETLTRFLTGLMVPMFSRTKVKQLSGFACCQHIRFQEVKAKVLSLQI